MVLENLKDADEARKRTFSEIREHLKENICDYRQYIKLGEWYEAVNIDQAYLTYEQARYFLKREESPEEQKAVLPELERKISALKQDARFHVHPASIIVVSFNTLDLTKKCLECIRATCDMEAVEPVFVDNDSHDGSREWLREQKDIVFVESDHNAGFPGGCNLGFRAANPQNDMLLLNSDTEVLENAVYLLRMGLYADRKIGMAGGFSNVNYARELPETLPKIPGPDGWYDYAKKVNIPGERMVCGKVVLHAFFVIVRRDVFNRVGDWDELYNPGYYDDDDYSYRVLKAGYRNAVCWNSFIIHRSSQTFKKNAFDQRGLLRINYGKFLDKWGFSPLYYSDNHGDLLSLITHGHEEPFKALFVGCGCGAPLCSGAYNYPNSQFVGIERDSEIAAMGEVLADVTAGDVETMELPYQAGEFDYIFIVNTLEQAADPEKVLLRLREYLAPEGKFICSILNALNAEVVHGLLCGGFSLREIGVRHVKNINFFTENDMRKLFLKAGVWSEFILSINLKELNSNNWEEMFSGICAMENTAERRRFDAQHYVFRLSKISSWKDNPQLREKEEREPVQHNSGGDALAGLILHEKDSAFRLLQVGCGNGGLLERLRQKFPNAKMYGVEKDAVSAAEAAKRAYIFQGDIERDYLPYEEEFFDYIVLADVIPDLYDAPAVLKKLRPYLKKDGFILSTIDNVLNAEIIYDLLQGNFYYTAEGKKRFRHIRLYTLNEIRKLYAESGFAVNFNVRVQAPPATTAAHPAFFDALCRIKGVVERRQFDEWGYMMRISKK